MSRSESESAMIESKKGDASVRKDLWVWKAPLGLKSVKEKSFVENWPNDEQDEKMSGQLCCRHVPIAIPS